MKTILFFLIFLFLSNVSACSYLQCSNFTDSQKRNDCNYVLDQGFNEDEEQELLCAIWEQSYDFDNWNPETVSINLPDYSAQQNQVNNSNFIIASRILLFLLLNYFIFSLTRHSFFRKWLIAAS